MSVSRRHARASAGRMIRLARISGARVRSDRRRVLALRARLLHARLRPAQGGHDLRRLRRAPARGARRLAQGLRHARDEQCRLRRCRGGRDDGGAASSSFLIPTAMSITVTGLDSSSCAEQRAVGGPRPRAGDRHVPVEARRARAARLVGHDVDHDAGDHRVAAGAGLGLRIAGGTAASARAGGCGRSPARRRPGRAPCRRPRCSAPGEPLAQGRATRLGEDQRTHCEPRRACRLRREADARAQDPHAHRDRLRRAPAPSCRATPQAPPAARARAARRPASGRRATSPAARSRPRACACRRCAVM